LKSHLIATGTARASRLEEAEPGLDDMFREHAYINSMEI